MRYRDQHWGNPHQIVAVSAADLIRVHGKRASESVDEREESEEKEKRMV